MPDYEATPRLADREQQEQVRDILGLNGHMLNNVDSLPEPGNRVGTGRVRRFAAPNAFVRPPTSRNENSPRAQPQGSQTRATAPSPDRTSGRSGPRDNQATATAPSLGGTSSQSRLQINQATAAAQSLGRTRAPSRLPQERVGGSPAADGSSSVAIELQPTQRVAGYAGLASFISSDKVFCVFRRFDKLSTRNLLYLQDEICELEERLDALDQADLQSRNHVALYSLHSRRHDRNAERRVIMQTLDDKLYAYQKRLCLHSRCLQMEKARDMYLESVRNWVQGEKPVVEAESHFLDDQNDLASLGLKIEEYHFFEKWVEKHFSQVFASKRHRKKPLYGKEVQYYSATSIRRLVRAALTIAAVIFLVAPLFALNYARKQELRLALIGVFSLIFALAVSFATKSRNFEIFAAIAAYAAVLVVFVGNNSSPGL